PAAEWAVPRPGWWCRRRRQARRRPRWRSVQDAWRTLLCVGKTASGYPLARQLAGEGIAAHAEPRGGLAAAPAATLQRGFEQRLLHPLAGFGIEVGDPLVQALARPGPERVVPGAGGRRCRGGVRARRRAQAGQVGGLDPLRS